MFCFFDLQIISISANLIVSFSSLYFIPQFLWGFKKGGFEKLYSQNYDLYDPTLNYSQTSLFNANKQDVRLNKNLMKHDFISSSSHIGCKTVTW